LEKVVQSAPFKLNYLLGCEGSYLNAATAHLILCYDAHHYAVGLCGGDL
jgi:hypothetical protein